MIIEPVFFPFTWLDADIAARLSACFGRVRLYLPSEASRQEIDPQVLAHGGVEALYPFADDGREVDRLFLEYQQWRQANRGTDIAFFKTSDGNPPFFNDNTISFLRQNIQRAVSGVAEETREPSLTARVFLRLTAHYDRTQTDISTVLRSQGEKENAMLAALQGGEDEDADAELSARTAANPPPDPGAIMAAERLSAWALLAAAGPPASLYLTTSPAILAAVGQVFEKYITVWDNIIVPAQEGRLDAPQTERWQKDLAAFICRLGEPGLDDRDVGAPPSSSGDQTGGRLTLLRLKDISTRIFLKNLQNAVPENFLGTKDEPPASTVVAALLPA